MVKVPHLMVKECHKIAMLIDNLPVHSKIINSKNIRLVFLRPNVTYKLQPMKHGVIKNLKCHYHRRILKKILNAMDKNQSVIKVVNLHDCISELQQ